MGLHFSNKKNISTNRIESIDYSSPASHSQSPKSKTVALLLCIFLGILGIHRFYVGKIGSGIIWFLTLGVFGIGWIVDIITIILGKFSDVNGLLITD